MKYTLHHINLSCYNHTAVTRRTVMLVWISQWLLQKWNFSFLLKFCTWSVSLTCLFFPLQFPTESHTALVLLTLRCELDCNTLFFNISFLSLFIVSPNIWLKFVNQSDWYSCIQTKQLYCLCNVLWEVLIERNTQWIQNQISLGVII